MAPRTMGSDAVPFSSLVAPSIWCSSSVFTLLECSSSVALRFRQRLSISSMNMTACFSWCRAWSNRSRTSLRTRGVNHVLRLPDHQPAQHDALFTFANPRTCQI